nr:hypothetical protein [Tanacetum cinerariifolium]
PSLGLEEHQKSSWVPLKIESMRIGKTREELDLSSGGL